MPINKHTEKIYKQALKTINKKYGLKLSYKELQNKVRGLMTKSGREREDAFTKAYIDLANALCTNVLKEAVVHGYNMSYPNRNNAVDTFSITTQTKAAKTIIDDMCNLIEPDYIKNNPITERQLDAIRDFELEKLNSHTFNTDLADCLKGWNIDCYKADLEDINETFHDDTKHVYGENKNVLMDVCAAECYQKLLLTQARLDKHGSFWRFFNSKKVEAYTNYINTISEKLRKIGFDPVKHGESSVKLLDTIIRPIELDIEAVKKSHKNLVSLYRKNYTEPITVGRDKLAKAKALEENPETSIMKELEPLLDKYNLDSIDLFSQQSKIDLENASLHYDTTRFVDGYRDPLSSVYAKSYWALAVQSLKTTGDINVREIIKDSRKIMLTVAKRYTPMIEANAFDEMKKPFYQKIRVNALANQFERAIKKENLNIPPEKIEAIKKEAMDFLREWEKDPRKVVLEDIEMSKNPHLLTLDSANDDVKDSFIDSGFMENSSLKEKLSINFDSELADFDISSPIESNKNNAHISLS